MEPGGIGPRRGTSARITYGCDVKDEPRRRLETLEETHEDQGD